MKQLNFYTLFLLLLFFSHSTVAQHLSASNYNLHRAPAFLENKGQVVDQNDHLRKDVRFIYDNQKGLKLILKDHSFSYEVYSYEKQPKKNISEATGQPIEGQLPDKFKEPDPVTVKINRIDIDLKGSNAHPEIISEGRSADYVNYYKEYAGENGVTDIHYYSKVTYRNIYRNIDFVFLAQADGSFKYNIVVHPGGRLSDVTMIYSGMKELSTFGNKLETKTALGGVEETIPFSYIKETGEKMLVQYACKGGLITLFAEEENKGTLVIDPVVREWGTYFGGSNDDNGWGLAVDSSGNILVSGQTFSSSGIVSSGSYQTFIGGGLDAFLVKFSNSGSRLWATYFGEMGDEAGRGVVADALGNAYMAGYTSSTSGIATTGSYQTSNAGGKDAFVVKFNSSGILNWATYYGGSNDDLAYGIALDTSANIYIAGYTSSASGIASSAAFQKSYSGGKDAFLAKFDSSGSRSWGTYYGGTNDDLGEAVATDKEGDVYLTGYTSSLGLYSSGAFQTSFGGGGEDAFLAKFSSSGSRVWGTLYGGSGYDYGYSLAMDTSGNVYLAGQTGSTSGIATTGASQTSRNGNADAFIVKFSSTGSRSWGTYFGGNSYDWGYGIATDRTGNIYLTGYTFSSSGIATPRAYQTSLKGTGNGYCVKFNSFGSKRWATYYGDGYEAVYAIAIDQMSNVYITGNTKSLNGIASPGAFQTKEGGSLDCFLVEFSDVMLDAGVISVDSLASSYCGETTKDVYARIKNFSTNKINTFYVGWSVNGSLQVAIKDSSGLIAGDTSPVIKLGTYKFSGGSDTLKVWTYNPNDSTDRNHWNDTFQQIAVISALPSVVFNAANTCMGSAVPLKNQSSILTGAISSFIWDFGDGTTSTLKTPVKVYLQPGHYTIRLVAIATAGCSDSVKKTITVYPLPQADFNAGNFCTGESIGLINNSKSDPTFPKVSYHWDFGDSTTSQDSLPVKIYQNAGIYNIRLVVTDSAACSDTAVRRIIINTAPKIAFNVENTCAGESLVLNLTKDSAGKHIFFWNFGDGITSADSLPVHIFSSSGTYTIRLTATTDHGCTNVAEHTVQIFPISTARFTATGVCNGDSMHFTNLSTIASGSINSYLWDFGDGSADTNRSPAHLYASAGLYRATLYTSTQYGCTDSFSDTVKIFGIPKAFIRDTSVCTGQPFSLTSAGGDSLDFRWYVNDSFVSSDSILWQTYKMAGKYKVALVVDNQNSCRDSANAQIIVLPSPSAAVSSKVTGRTVAYMANDTSSTDTYFWNFGDGDTSTVMDPTHTYLKDSVYEATLVVTSQNGCSSTYHQQVGTNTGISPLLFTELNLLVYPDPFTDRLLVRCEGMNCNRKLQFFIINMEGHKLIEKALQGEGDFSISTDILSPGGYLVYISDGKQVFTKTIVKQ